MYVCMFACMYACMHVHVCTYVYAYVVETQQERARVSCMLFNRTCSHTSICVRVSREKQREVEERVR